MIELFTFGSTNGHKVAIALEELGLAYEVHPVDVVRAELLEVSPTKTAPQLAFLLG